MKTRILPLLAATMMFLPGVAQAGREMSVINYNWDIFWSDATARATSIESGREVVLFQDWKGESEEDGYGNFSMLSVVGNILSWRYEWYSEGGAHPSYGVIYETADLSKVKADIPADARLPEANLSELFGEAAVFEALRHEPSVVAAIEGRFDEIALKKPPREAPKDLRQLLEQADGGCRANMGENLLSDFRFAFLLGGKVAAVQIGLGHGCEVMRGEFTRLDRIYLPVPDALAEDFERAVKAGSLEFRDFAKPSFDCNKAGNAIEYAICADAKLAALDVQMGAAYKAARNGAAGSAKNKIKQDQRTWIKQRNADCAGGNIDCLKKSYEARLAELG